MTLPIGSTIREARQNRGLSLRQLASEVEIHFSHLSKIENGRDSVSKSTLIRIAEALQADVQQMLGQAGHQPMPFRVLGKIAAGTPIEAVLDCESFDLSQMFDPQQHFLLRVEGDSMVLDGIHDGDMAIIRPADDARNGDTVVAIVPDEQTTLKRFKKSRNKITLIPANDSLDPIIYPAADVTIRGVLVGVIRTQVR